MFRDKNTDSNKKEDNKLIVILCLYEHPSRPPNGAQLNILFSWVLFASKTSIICKSAKVVYSDKVKSAFGALDPVYIRED